MAEQLSLFDAADDSDQKARALWEPRDIWLNFSENLAGEFAEDRRVEYKSSRRLHFDTFSEYLSMYSNTAGGGCMVFGVANSGEIEGCSEHLSTDQINKLETTHLIKCPEAKPEFKRVPVSKNSDFIICVYIPYIGKLIETNKGESFIRYGESKHRMSDVERQDFRSSRHEGRFEFEFSPFSWPSDFDAEVVSSICDEFRQREGKSWSNEEVLEDRMLLKRDGNRLRATHGFAIIAESLPRIHYPGCRVRLQRFKRPEEGAGESFSPIRDKYIEGNVVRILEKAKKDVEDLNFDVTWLNEDGKFQNTKEYPFYAWYEALVNALVHRSYNFSGSEVTIKFFNNRLEVESPGGFVPPVNADNILRQRASRNPNICDALRYIGYTRMTREGTRRMVESMAKWRLPPPTYSEESVNGVSVRVTLRNDILSRERTSEMGLARYIGTERWKDLKQHQIQIMSLAFMNGVIHVNEAASITGRTWNTSKKDLNKLVEIGLLGFVKPRFNRDPKSHYYLPDKEDSSGNPQ